MTDPTHEEALAVARAMYDARGEKLNWRTPSGRQIPRWSCSDYPEGTPPAERYALDDGHPAGELERDAWVEAAIAVWDLLPLQPPRVNS